MIDITESVSADRIFGLLERDFYRQDIYKAVAEALHAQDGIQDKNDKRLGAHQTMLRLATTPTGHVQLVTTNFDRLFNLCDPTLKTYCPPTLPDLSSEIDGIVYLHGKINESGTGA